MESICRFASLDEKELNIHPLRFVYETELKKFSQPFSHPYYKIFVVTSGTAKLSFNGNNYHISKGDFCFFSPNQIYTLDMDDNFNIIYLDFYSSNLTEFFTNKKISFEPPVFYGLDFLLSFLESTINKVRNYNSNMIIKSTIFYVISNLFILVKETKFTNKQIGTFEGVLDFVNTNFNDPMLSLKKLSEKFSYSEKHISRLFFTKIKTGFNKYLNNLRLDYAINLLDEGIYSIKDIAFSCGFVDPLYFSRVFKKRYKLSPSEYARTSPKRVEKDFFNKYSVKGKF